MTAEGWPVGRMAAYIQLDTALQDDLTPLEYLAIRNPQENSNYARN